MSTKIYNGFRIDHQSTYQIHEQVHAIFKKLAKIQKDQYLKIFFNMFVDVVDFVDHLRVDGEEYGFRESQFKIKKDESIRWYVSNLISERQREVKKTGLRDPAVDFDFEVCLIPDKKTKAIYGIVYTESQAMLNAWFRSPGVKEYRYWDNTDRPSRIAVKEWKERNEVWDRILGYAPPGDVGFTYTLRSLRDYEMQQEISKNFDKYNKKYALSTEARARLVAEGILRNQYFENKKPAGEIDDLFYSRTLREFEKRFKEGDFDGTNQILVIQKMPKIRTLTFDMKF